MLTFETLHRLIVFKQQLALMIAFYVSDIFEKSKKHGKSGKIMSILWQIVCETISARLSHKKSHRRGMFDNVC